MVAKRTARAYRRLIPAGLLVCILGFVLAISTLFAGRDLVIASATPNNLAASVVDAPADPPILVGHVTWQGISQPNSRNTTIPITPTLKMDSVEVNYPAQTTDVSGVFTVSVGDLAPGVYTWRVKSLNLVNSLNYSKHLANSGVVTLAGDPSTYVEMGTMRAGDINNDNIVNSTDFNLYTTSFHNCGPMVEADMLTNKQAGSNLPARQGIDQGSDYCHMADFDNDGVTRVTDFNLLKTNYGRSGAPPTSGR